jgi:hypothetical protein
MDTTSHRNHLVVSGLNCQGIENKKIRLEDMVVRAKIDILCVNETWLTSNVSSDRVNLPNFTFHRRDRTTGLQHGGCGLFVSNDLAAKRRSDLEDDQFEALVVEVGCSNKTVTVCSFYRRGLDSLPEFANFLDGFFRRMRNKPFLLIGDINSNFLDKRSPDTILLSTLFASYGAKQLVKGPTRIYHNAMTDRTSESLIDIIVSNRPNMCSRVSVPPKFSDISDHSAIMCNYQTVIPKIPKRQHYMRDTCSRNIFKFVQLISETNFRPIENADVITASQMYDNLIDEAVAQCFPYKHFKTTEKHLPTMTPYMLAQIQKKYELLRVARRVTATADDRRRFNVQSNLVRRMAAAVQKTYITDQVRAARNDAANVWKILYKTLPIKNESKVEDITLSVDNRKISGNLDIATAFNVHFSSVGNRLASALPPAPKDPLDFVQPPTDNQVFSFQNVSVQEILKFLRGISPSKSSGDTIPFRVLKEVVHHIAQPITTIVNKSFMESIIPSQLKHATVSALFKAGEKDIVTNYRPISVLPIAAKALEHCAHEQISQFLEHKGLYRYQSAYRKAHSTEMALNFVTSEIYENLENKMRVVIVFIDLAKAFDTIDHNILLRKLEIFGVTGRAQTWFRSLLNNRTQSVKLNGCISDASNLDIGIPQGSALGPCLFNFFMNDIGNYSVTPEGQLPPQLFADDTALIFSGRHANSVSINQALTNLMTWMTSNRLTLNASKTKYMLFGKNLCPSDLDIRIGNEPVERVNDYKYLGFHIQDNLSHQLHIQKVIQSVARINGILYSNRTVLTPQINEAIVTALVLPKISYCDTVYGKAASSNIAKLDIAYRKIIKTSYRLPLCYPTNLVYRKKFRPLLLLRQLNAAKASFRILTGQCPLYMTGIILQVSPGVRRRPERAVAARNRRYIVPFARTERYTHSIRFWAPERLNQVPEHIINVSLQHRFPLEKFKKSYSMFICDIFNETVWSRECEITNLILS